MNDKNVEETTFLHPLNLTAWNQKFKEPWPSLTTLSSYIKAGKLKE